MMQHQVRYGIIVPDSAGTGFGTNFLMTEGEIVYG